MIRLNIPDASDERALEAYVASLNKSAREGVRRSRSQTKRRRSMKRTPRTRPRPARGTQCADGPIRSGPMTLVAAAEPA